MDDSFKIWIDRLKNGQTQKIAESLAPSFLDVQEEELQFRAPVQVKGEAYLTESELILHLNASTSAKMPCAICNKMIDIPLKIGNFYHAEPMSEIRDAIFDFRKALREALLIELPQYVECRGGNCPDRCTLKPYMREENRKDKTTYFPFSGLDNT